MPTVSVIIVNHNGAALLPACLLSLREQTFGDFEVVFVDNGSTDGSAALAAELFPGVCVLALPCNRGFAAANNLGIEKAHGEFLVLLNNDTRADGRFLEELVAAARRESRIGMAAPKILDFAAGRTIDSVGGLLLTRDGIGQGRGRGEPDHGQYDREEFTLVPSACAALYRRQMLAEIGGFAEDFFAYCEDVDLGLRGLWAGWKTASAPRAVVYHKYSASAGAASTLKLRLVERNHYLTALRNFPSRRLVFLFPCTAYRLVLMAAALVVGRGKGSAVGRGRAFSLAAAVLRGLAGAALAACHRRQRPPTTRRLSSREFNRLLDRFHLPIRRLIWTK